jgi:hypothetical protein
MDLVCAAKRINKRLTLLKVAVSPFHLPEKPRFFLQVLTQSNSSAACLQALTGLFSKR